MMRTTAVAMVRIAIEVMRAARSQAVEATMKGAIAALVMMEATRAVIRTAVMVKAEDLQDLVMRHLAMHLGKVSLAIFLLDP
jgi:hypothetical protein